MAQSALILDRYEPLGKAGAGGFGTVQVAWDPRIQRKVAIKTIPLSETDVRRVSLPGASAPPVSPTANRWHGVQPWSEYLASADGLSSPQRPNAYPLAGEDANDNGEDSFSNPAYPAASIDPVTSLAHIPGLDEARTAAKLHDSRIVTVFDFEVRDHVAYLIMEYVEGITLTRFLANCEDYLTLDVVAAVFDAVAGALTTAHKAGVLHLDIKPDNIMINAEGQVKVTDFGLATLADAAGEGTAGGGTIGYMPLEQMRREPLDARTDEWSLAAVAYEMLVGDNPFRAPTLEAAQAAVQDAELVLPSLCWEHIDSQIDDVLFYALDPDPGQRYANVADFAEEVDKFLGDAQVGYQELAVAVSAVLGLVPEDDSEADYDYANGDFSHEANTGVEALLWRFRSSSHASALVANDNVLAVGARAFAACASGFLAWLAATNFPALASLLGAAGVPYAVAVLALVGVVLGAVFPHVGALVAYAFFGIALVASGNPVLGVLLLVATGAWWYTVGRKSMASANVALLGPVAGAFGAAELVPFAAGATLRPVAATATMAFSAFVALVFASFGSASLLDWNVVSFWDFSNAAGSNVASTVVALLLQPVVWATMVGWLAAALVLSVFSLRESRLFSCLGLALAVVAALAGPLLFSEPSPQLIVPIALAAVAVLVLRVCE